MSANKNLVLNMSESVEQEFLDFLHSLGCEVITRDTSKDYELINFILVDTEEEAKIAARDFASAKNEIDIVCLRPVKETRSFLISGGRLFIQPGLEKTAAGAALLKKFFTKSFDIHLDEAFGREFSECDSFKVVNLLSSGLSIDTMAVKAFEKGFNVIALRSFMDHSMAYFTYLKQAGLAGAPFEVEYSFNKETFAINIHAPVKNFAAEYLLDSFGSVNSKDPIQYLLGVVSRSADFTDITHVEDPGRVVLTGFWSKDSQKPFRGLAFNNIFTTAQLNRQIEKKIRPYQAYESVSSETDKMADELAEKYLPGGILEMALNAKEDSFLKKDPQGSSRLVAFAIGRFEELAPDTALNEMTKEDLEKVLADHSDQETVQKISEEDKEELLNNIHKKNITEAYNQELQRARSNLREDEDYRNQMSKDFSAEVAQRVSSGLSAEDLNQLVSGGEENDEDFKSVVKGARDKKEKEFVQSISGGFKENASQFKTTISGSGEDLKKGMFNFVDNCLKGLDNIDADQRATRFIKSSASEKIAKGLENYAHAKGLSVEDLDEELLSDFQETELQKIVESALVPSSDASAPLKARFKEKLEQKLVHLQSLTDENISDEKTQQVIQGAMREALEEEYRFSEGSKEEIEAKENMVVKGLAQTFNKEDGAFFDSVSAAFDVVKKKETQKVMESLFKEAPNGEEGNIQNLAQTKLLEKIKALEIENRKLKDQAQVSTIESEAKTLSDQAVQKVDQACAQERDEAGQNSTELEKEVQILQTELNKRESLFRSEIGRSTKALKSKELIVEKLKEKMQWLSEKKRAELLNAKEQIEELNQRLHDDKAVKLETDLAHALKELESSKKVADLYRAKVENLLRTKNKEAEEDPSEQLAAENRSLGRLKVQLENQLNAQLKEKKGLETRLERLKDNEVRLRTRASGAESKLEQSMDQIEKLKANESRLVAIADKKDGEADQKLLKEIESLKGTNAQLQGALKEMSEKSKGAAAQAGPAKGSGMSPKEKYLEQNVKKLNSELSKARNEVAEQKKQMMKMKNETVALKNKINQLEKTTQSKSGKNKSKNAA